MKRLRRWQPFEMIGLPMMIEVPRRKSYVELSTRLCTFNSERDVGALLNRGTAAGWAGQDEGNESVSGDVAIAFFDARAGW